MPAQLEGRAAFRCTSPDYLPIVGPLADHWQLSLGLAIIVLVALLPRGLMGLAGRPGRNPRKEAGHG